MPVKATGAAGEGASHLSPRGPAAGSAPAFAAALSGRARPPRRGAGPGTPRSPLLVVAGRWGREAGPGLSSSGPGLVLLVTSSGVRFSCLSPWLRCHVLVAGRGAVVRGPTTDGPAKRPLSLHDPEASRLPLRPAEKCQSFRAPFTSVSLRSSGAASDFPAEERKGFCRRGVWCQGPGPGCGGR